MDLGGAQEGFMMQKVALYPCSGAGEDKQTDGQTDATKCIISLLRG